MLAAGLGATTMFGITAVLALEATADTTTQPEVAVPLAPAATVTSAAPLDTTPLDTTPLDTTPLDTTPAAPAGGRTIDGTLPPGFTIDDIDIDSIPEGGVLTGELSDDGRPIVVVFHAPTAPAATVPAAVPSVATSPAPAPAAPTALTATPVITEVAVPAPAPAAPPATTSGS